MAGEIASAYISLLPKLDGRGLVKAGDEAGGLAGERAGKSFSSHLGGLLKKSAVGVGVAAGGVLAASLVKGWGRLTSIENATAKLTGLGNSASSVKSIMDNALASVRGTAFGLDEAATTAAGAVAAGIKPGKDLEHVLKTVADTATIAGKSMADTGAIFGSVAARGKLQGDDLMQLQSAGVPVLAMLAKHYKITAAEASKMVSKGEVDFKNFNAALSENLGGAALKSGETTQGAFKNMGAAVSRFGQTLLKGVFPLAKEVFGGITSLLDKAGAAIEPFADAVSKKVVNAFHAAKDAAADFGPKVRAALQPAARLVTAWSLDVRTTLSRTLADAPAGVVLGWRDIFSNGLGKVANVVSGFARDVWAAFKPGLLDTYRLAVDSLRKSFDAIKPYAEAVFGRLKDTWQQLLPILPQLVSLLNPIGTVLRGMMPALPVLAEAVGKVAQSLADALLPILPPLLDVLTKIANAGLSVFADALVAVLKPAAEVVKFLAPLAPIVFGTWAAFKGYKIAVAAMIAVRSAADTLALRAMYAGGALRGLGASMVSMRGGALGAAGAAAGLAAGLKALALVGPGAVADQVPAVKQLIDVYKDATHSVDTSAAAVLRWAATAKDAHGTIGGIVPQAMKQMKLSADELATAVAGSDDEFGKFIAKAKDTPGVTGATVSSLQRFHDAWKNTAQATDSSTTSLRSATTAMQNQVSASDALRNALDRLSGKAINTEQAALNLQQGINSLKDQVIQAAAANEEGARTLDASTAAGLRNRQSLLSLIQQTNAHVQAMADQGAGAAEVAAALKKDEDAIRAAAEAAGLNKQQVEAMIKQYAAVPKDVKTAITVDIGGAFQAIRRIKDELGTITGVQIGFGGGSKSGIGINAAGTDDWRGGLTWVGERGPEIVALPPHSAVINNRNADKLGGSMSDAQFDALLRALGRIEAQTAQVGPTVAAGINGVASKAVNIARSMRI